MRAVRFATNHDMQSDMVDSFLDSVLSRIKSASGKSVNDC
jgi:hypothetical protein